MMRFDEDDTLIQQIADHNQDAFKKLYTRHYRRVYRYLWYRLDRDTSWTEEITQDVFLNIWRSAKNYRRDAQVITWILHIAQHLSANAIRNLARRPEGHLLEHRSEGTTSFDEQDVNDLEVSRIFLASHEEDVLRRLVVTNAIEKLPVKSREILELVFYQDRSLNEVSSLLDIPLGTVKSRLNSARHILFALLCQAEVLEGRSNEK